MDKIRDRVPKKSPYERVIFSLPPGLAGEARRYADAFHEGNNSGFVAAAIRNYIDQLRKTRHTARLRASYAAAARHGAAVAREWDAVSEEAWQKLDATEARGQP
ncbi:MAG TPA: hypothetical protein VND64_01170 [Pirellulales bacterium]|nr:hypothetical protein [Pirellulales bacterium]